MYQPRKNEGLERNFRGIRTVFERCYKPGSVLGVFLGIILGYSGSFAAPLFWYARHELILMGASP